MTTRTTSKAKVAVELPPEPTITPEMIAEMRAAESLTVERLKQEPLEEVYVPKRGLTIEDTFKVILNGVRFSYELGKTHQMPKSIAALARVRIDAVKRADPAHVE